MGDAEPAFLLGQHQRCRIDRLSFTLAVGHCACGLDAMARNQLVDFTHGFIAPVFIHFCKWDSTDAGYLKVIWDSYY